MVVGAGPSGVLPPGVPCGFAHCVTIYEIKGIGPGFPEQRPLLCCGRAGSLPLGQAPIVEVWVWHLAVQASAAGNPRARFPTAPPQAASAALFTHASPVDSSSALTELWVRTAAETASVRRSGVIRVRIANGSVWVCLLYTSRCV